MVVERCRGAGHSTQGLTMLSQHSLQGQPFSEMVELKTSEKERKEKASKINVSLAKSGLRLTMKSLNYSRTFL